MDALRRIYQRAVQIPLEIVEQLWSDYNAFEIGLNKITVRRICCFCSRVAERDPFPRPASSFRTRAKRT
jgi:hypothetical protein